MLLLACAEIGDNLGAAIILALFFAFAAFVTWRCT
jgi:hypothetical protein